MASFSFYNNAPLLVLLICALLAHCQTTPRPATSSTSSSSNASAGTNTSNVCSEMMKLSDELDALLYESEGVGAPIAAAEIDWDQVSTYLASNFTWYDNSALSSRGNYSDYRTYWEALDAATTQYPMLNATRQWASCDPVTRRQFTQWRETYGSAADPSRSEVSTSIYVTQYDPQLKFTSQSYWTSGNLANLTRGST